LEEIAKDLQRKKEYKFKGENHEINQYLVDNEKSENS